MPDLLLEPAPDWTPERSEHIVLWHGCTLLAKDSIETNGIDLTRCAPDTDFGRGFYTTTLERQARYWATEQHRRWEDDHPGATGNPPVVMRFRVRRYMRLPRVGPVDDGLDQLHRASALCYERRPLRGENISEDFAPEGPSFVAQGGSPVIPGGTYLLDALIAAGKGKGPDGTGDPDFYQWFEVK